jgi:hypothetical protein
MYGLGAAFFPLSGFMDRVWPTIYAGIMQFFEKKWD